MGGTRQMAYSHRRKTFITNLFTLLDFLTAGIYYLDFFFFKAETRHGFCLLLRKLTLAAGQRMHSGGWSGAGRAVRKEGRGAPHRKKASTNIT